MKKIIILLAIFSFMFACEKSQDKISSEYIARIVGFDLNCSTCILAFPDDSLQVKKEIGQSPDNYYQAINLSRGNYEIGQKLKVRLRKAEAAELQPCITMYPSYNYEGVFITDFENFNSLTFNDTINLSYRECLNDPENQIYLCLDSVVNDSRCPTGAYCFWEGNAKVRFKFEKYTDKPVYFSLNTNRQFPADTIIDGYKFSLISLKPHPALERRINQKDYKAELIVKKE